MNTKRIYESILSLMALTVIVPMTSACDTGDELGAELSEDELDDDVELRNGPPLAATKWRIRNAAVQANTGQWVFREIDFCADPACNHPIPGGMPFDSGDSANWASPQNAFDNNNSTMWKTFDADVADIGK